jgi:murein DD-endopeptidase MepM/ murein hydrolase activator NlpD
MNAVRRAHPAWLVALALVGCAASSSPVVCTVPVIPEVNVASTTPEPAAAAPMVAAPVADTLVAPPVVAEPPKPHSAQLPSGFFNPMPGGVMAGYQADTGLDIAGTPRPVYAIAAGTLDYSEPGHTLWTGPADTPNCIRIELDEPIALPKGRRVTHVYYAHLSRLETLQHEGETPRRHVDAGEMLGVSGVARHAPHLHLGFLLDGEVEQYSGTFLLADGIRRLLGGYKNGDKLPRGP